MLCNKSAIKIIVSANWEALTLLAIACWLVCWTNIVLANGETPSLSFLIDQNDFVIATIGQCLLSIG